MRFVRNLPRHGYVRINKGFLWFPKTVEDYYGMQDTRWLCWAKWEEQYSHLGYSRHMWWKPIRWID